MIQEKLGGEFMLVVMSGVSGVGKNTIIRRLMDEYSNMHFFKSATTRPIRPGEDIYISLTEEEFLAAKERGEFFETVEAHGYHYGTFKKDLQRFIDEPQNIFIKDIEVLGNREFRKFLKGKAKVLSIFLEAPDDVLFDRLVKRGESEERARVRISRSKMEREYKKDYDLIIENLDIEKTLSMIRERFKKEGY